MHLHHCSVLTEKSYCYWIRYFIRLHQLQHSVEWGAIDTRVFSVG
ncbi:MAG: hypothetical protein V4812_18140 [Pseudomonadota bacterium]